MGYDVEGTIIGHGTIHYKLKLARPTWNDADWDYEADLPNIDELSTAGLIDTSSVDSTIFGTGKFYKEKQEEKKENIYSDIDEMLSSTLKNDDNE